MKQFVSGAQNATVLVVRPRAAVEEFQVWFVGLFGFFALFCCKSQASKNSNNSGVPQRKRKVRIVLDLSLSAFFSSFFPLLRLRQT